MIFASGPDHRPSRRRRIAERERATRPSHAAPRRSGRTWRRASRSTACAAPTRTQPSGTPASIATRSASPRRRPGARAPRRPRPRRARPRVAALIRARGGFASARLLQRRRAPHQRIGEIDRHVGDRARACRRSRRQAPRSRPACALRQPARQSASSLPSSLVAHRLDCSSKSNPGSPSSVPSTRSTFHAGRVSPERQRDAVEALRAALRS